MLYTTQFWKKGLIYYYFTKFVAVAIPEKIEAGKLRFKNGDKLHLVHLFGG